MIKVCQVAECSEPHHCKSFCKRHYQQSKRGTLGSVRVPPPHGSHSRYANQKCRCDLCREAWNKYCASQKQKRVGQFLPPHKEHGKSSSYQWGCRCQPCTTANTVYTKERYRLITSTQREELLLAQENRCASCGRSDKRLVVDHIHGTFHVRGLLCDSCNTGIGKLGDSIEGLERALDYLKRTTPDRN